MWDFFKYFLIEGLSILVILLCSIFLAKKTKEISWKPCVIYYILSTGIEFLGHFLGWWHWFNLFNIFHHTIWWMLILILDEYWLSSLSKKGRFLILFNGIMLYQILQEWLVKYVTHYKLFGSEYNMVSLVSLIVCIGCILIGDIKKMVNIHK